MVALRKVAFLLALLTIAALSSGVAQAQALSTCTATAVPPVVRAEGIAELVGDIVLTCFPTPGIPPFVNALVNVSVSLNVNVTNNITGSTTDAVLVVNENNCTTPSFTGNVDLCGDGAGGAQDPQFGVLAAVNRVEWNEMRYPFPGATGNPAVTTIRVTSMRANASQLGVPDEATFPSTQITAFISLTGPTVIPVTNNVLNVAVPILGLIVSAGPKISGLQCLSGTGHTYIKVKEGFATAFKTLGVATFTPGNTQWESGYYAPWSNNGAGATQGTRFLIRFFDIPDGVDVSVDKYIDWFGLVTDSCATTDECDSGDLDPADQCVTGLPGWSPPHTLAELAALKKLCTGDALALRYVSGADDDGAGGSISTATDTLTVSLSGGFGTVTYEVVDSNPFKIEDCEIPIWFAWTADTTNDLPEVTTGSVSASFAPLSDVVEASASAPEPRFLDTGGDPDPIITILRCTTTILFPFVTNQAGFDTGLAISNTSQDWLGTEPQDGACTLHFHGSTTGGGAAPGDMTSTVLAGGEQLIWTLSGGNAAQNIGPAEEFQGYIIAVCEFQFGHGYAFITDGFGGIPSMAQGYLALVIPLERDGTRLPGLPCTIGGCAGVGSLHLFGETLAH